MSAGHSMTDLLSFKVKDNLWRCSYGVAVVTFLYMLVLVPLFRCYATSVFGRDDLCRASYVGDTDKIQLLLNAGADPSQVGWDEHYTPLGEAVRGGRVESAQLLLACGADPNAANDHGFGQTAATTAKDYQSTRPAHYRQHVIELIRNAGGR